MNYVINTKKKRGRQPDMEKNEFFRLEVGEAYKLAKKGRRVSLTRDGLNEFIGERYHIAPTTAYDHYKFYNAHQRWIVQMRKLGFLVEDNRKLMGGVEEPPE